MIFRFNSNEVARDYGLYKCVFQWNAYTETLVIINVCNHHWTGHMYRHHWSPTYICGNHWSPDIHMQPQLIADIHVAPLLILTFMHGHHWSQTYMCPPLIPNVHVWLPWTCAATLNPQYTWRANVDPQHICGTTVDPSIHVRSVTIDIQPTFVHVQSTLIPDIYVQPPLISYIYTLPQLITYICGRPPLSLTYMWSHHWSRIYMCGHRWSHMHQHHWSLAFMFPDIYVTVQVQSLDPIYNTVAVTINPGHPFAATVDPHVLPWLSPTYICCHRWSPEYMYSNR